MAAAILTAPFMPVAAYTFYAPTIAHAAAATSSGDVPMWTYDAIDELAANGYLTVPDNIYELDRAQIARLIASGLPQLESSKSSTIVDEYARVTCLITMDETQLKFAKQQLDYANEQIEDAKRRSQSSTEALVRESINGQNRLEVMEPLKKKSDSDMAALEKAARDYAQAKSNVIRREAMLNRLKEHQAMLLSQIAGDAPTVGGARAYGGYDGYGGNTHARSTSTSASGTSEYDTSSTYVPSNESLDAAARLRAEYITELENIGYLDDENARSIAATNLPIKPSTDPRFKLDGEVRLDDGVHNGEEGIDDNRARARVRLYPDYNIDGNWHAKGMVEWSKTIDGDGGSDDGDVILDRYYLEGNVGAVGMDVGRFGSMMAEGNIYDSAFRGVRMWTGSPVRYQFELGKIDNAHHVWNLVASYDNERGGYDIGYFHFSPLHNTSRNIWMLNYRKPIGDFDLGLMFLRGHDSAAKSGNGFVATIAHGMHNTWRPGSSSYWLKYYRQPSSTYVQHTMNGMADYMNFDATPYGMPTRGGFKGFGLGYEYTIKPDLVFSLEYYNITDLWTDKRSSTIWGALTYFFSTYHEP